MPDGVKIGHKWSLSRVNLPWVYVYPPPCHGLRIFAAYQLALNESFNILTLAFREPALWGDLALVKDDAISVSGHTELRVQQYAYNLVFPIEDVAVAVYEPEGKTGAAKMILYYCLAGNRYCSDPRCKSGFCVKKQEPCISRQRSLEVFTITFHEAFFTSFQTGRLQSLISLFDTASGSTSIKTLSFCGKTRLTLEQILHHSYEGMLQQIFLQTKLMELLLCSADCMAQEKEEVFTCRFLANPGDREKIIRARDILVQNLENPITIRELSRKVAINECYLKKGFKEIFGTTIYDYFQKERMEKARWLLYEKGFSVSETAGMLGYSCISHFSTAFRKHTGLKPCELLLK